jgi:polar amino acid transport system substrate-binding protein
VAAARATPRTIPKCGSSGAFQQIRQAMTMPKGKPAGLAYLKTFVEEMKASGFVADALKRSNQVAVVAPPAK